MTGKAMILFRNQPFHVAIVAQFPYACSDE